MSLATMAMARKKISGSERRPPDGVVLEKNLYRLGYCETVVKATEVSKLVTQRTGKSMSRQRIAQLLNAVVITPATLAVLAEGLGVEVGDLTTWQGDEQ